MRFMSYNILAGGHEQQGDRTGLLVDVIRAAAPDILALTECRGFHDDDQSRLRLFERELGLTGVINVAQTGNHIAILHRPQLRVVGASTRAITMLHGLVRIVVETRALGPVAVVATHFHPFSASYRVSEAEFVASRAAAAEEAIVMGDLNSLAPSDLPIDLGGAPRTLVERLRGPSGELDSQAVEVLLNRGYVDLGASTAARPTYPTLLADERSTPLVRLDYMLATPGLAGRCGMFRVIDEQIAHRASDHLALVADFDLDGDLS